MIVCGSVNPSSGSVVVCGSVRERLLLSGS